MNYPAASCEVSINRKFLSHYIVTAQQAARYYVTIKTSADLMVLAEAFMNNLYYTPTNNPRSKSFTHARSDLTKLVLIFENSTINSLTTS